MLATRNPIEFHGTFPVPEAALDRFLVRVELDYPESDRELDLYLGHDPERELRALKPVIDRATLRSLMDAVREIKVSDAVASYCYRIVQKTRNHESITLGAGPRAAMSLLTACRARAMIRGRDYVLPDDLKQLANFVLPHRVFRHDAGPVAPLIAEIVEREPVEL